MVAAEVEELVGYLGQELCEDWLVLRKVFGVLVGGCLSGWWLAITGWRPFSQLRGANPWGGACAGGGTTGCCSLCSWLNGGVVCVMCGRLAITGWRPACVVGYVVVGMPCWWGQVYEVRRCSLSGLLEETCVGGLRVAYAPVHDRAASRCSPGVSVVVASVGRSVTALQVSQCFG